MDWLQIFGLCYAANGMGVTVRLSWPDGRSTLEQPAIAVSVLETIHASHQAESNRRHDERAS